MKDKCTITSAALHIFAMCCMLSDHLWATIVPGNAWMTCVGRLAFPIFAFMIAEGFRKTSCRKAYAKRLLFLALASEIPMNLMTSGRLFNLLHQNVIWTFLLAFCCMSLMEKAKEKYSAGRFYAVAAVIAFGGFLLGYALFLDYYGAGVLTVLVFYFFPKRNVRHFFGQLLCLYLIHVELLGGVVYVVEWEFGQLSIMQQGIALFSLLPIWLYRGRQGYHAKWFRLFCYGFYPVHMLVLYLLALL